MKKPVTLKEQPGCDLENSHQPNVVLALLDPQIQVAKSLDFSLVEQHYLKAREAFRDLLQDSRLALSLGL